MIFKLTDLHVWNTLLHVGGPIPVARLIVTINFWICNEIVHLKWRNGADKSTNSCVTLSPVCQLVFGVHGQSSGSADAELLKIRCEIDYGRRMIGAPPTAASLFAASQAVIFIIAALVIFATQLTKWTAGCTAEAPKRDHQMRQPHLADYAGFYFDIQLRASSAFLVTLWEEVILFSSRQDQRFFFEFLTVYT